MKKITTTIKQEYMDKILNGTKKVEYKKAKDFWNKRLEKLINEENVIINFVCGKRFYKYKVIKIIKINSSKIIDDETVLNYWEIHIGNRITGEN